MEPMTIGRLAKCAGVGVETVRFYQRSGLLETPPQPASGYRKYPPETILRIRFIKRAKSLGFSLKEIRELLELRSECATCGDVQARAEAKLKTVTQKIDELTRVRDNLEDLVRQCQSGSDIDACPIIEALVEDGIDLE